MIKNYFELWQINKIRKDSITMKITEIKASSKRTEHIKVDNDGSRKTRFQSI